MSYLRYFTFNFVPSKDLPKWEDIQILTAQLAKKPLLDNDKVGTNIIIGKNSKKPLTLNIPIFVSDMSFGAPKLMSDTKIGIFNVRGFFEFLPIIIFVPTLSLSRRGFFAS